MTIISGAKGYVQYGWEAVAYGTVATTIDKVFGHITSIDISQKNNNTKVYAIGDVEAKATIAGKYEGSLEVSFTPTDFYFLKGVFGSVVDAGSGPATHTYPNNTSEATKDAGMNTFLSSSVEIGLDLATDSVLHCLGGVMGSLTLSATQGEVVTCKMTMPFQTIAEDTDLDATPSSTAEAPFMFAQASFEMPNASAISNVESVEISINRNPESVYAIGSRLNVAQVPKQSDYEIKIVVPFEAAATLMETFFGAGTGPLATGSPAEVASAELTITNAGAGDALRSIVFLISDLTLDADSISLTQNEVVKEDVTILGRTITSAIYTNDVETAL